MEAPVNVPLPSPPAQFGQKLPPQEARGKIVLSSSEECDCDASPKETSFGGTSGPPSDCDRSLQDSGIFTIDSFVSSPEPFPSRRDSCEESIVSSSDDADKGISPTVSATKGVTTITIVCSDSSQTVSGSCVVSAKQSSEDGQVTAGPVKEVDRNPSKGKLKIVKKAKKRKDESFPASVVPSPSNRYPTNLKKENPSLSTSSTSNSPEDSPKEPPSSLPPPDIPKSHPACDPPLCPQCAKRGTEFFNLQCDGCWYSLKRTNLSPSQVFAVLRQWDSRVQKNIGPLVGLAIRGGCGINDRDAVTDMTLLHYAVKAGAKGVGEPSVAVQVVEELLLGGADVHQRCKWTHMTALHYAAFFDVPLVLTLLQQREHGVAIDDPCLEYDNGTPLHIAAANLCLSAARLLVQQGADVKAKDSKGRTPADCLPDPAQYNLVPDVQEIIQELRRFLCPKEGTNPNPFTCSSPNSGGCNVGGGVGGGKALLLAMGLKVGDRVMVNGIKTGVLRFVGCTEFATGLWAGVELESPEGKHNGTVRGVVYFRCANNYGLFVPATRLTKIPNVSRGRVKRRRRTPSQAGRKGRASPSRERESLSKRSLSLPPGRVNHGKVDVSKVPSRVAMDIKDDARRINVDDRVIVDMRLSTSTRSRHSSPRRQMRQSTQVSNTSIHDATNPTFKSNSKYSSSQNLSDHLPSVSAGVVRFAGSVGFASGYWIGVELDEAIGSNDGSVNGVRYFGCPSKHGIFVVPSRVVKVKPEENEMMFPYVHQMFHRSTNNISKNKNNSFEEGAPRKFQNKKKNQHIKAKVDHGQVRNFSDDDKINSKKSTNGTSSICGDSKSSSMQFATLPRRSKRKSSYSDSDMEGHTTASNSSADSDQEFFGLNSRHLGVLGKVPPALPNLTNSVKLEFYPTNTSISNLNKSFSARYVSSRLRLEELGRRKELESKEPQWEEVTKVPTPPRYNPQHLRRQESDPNWLNIGSNVFYRGKIGTLKYIGPVDFELGTWLGIELKDSDSGKHDGVVLGRRYFVCRPGRGVMVRPCKVTVRGINAADLVQDEEEDETFWI